MTQTDGRPTPLRLLIIEDVEDDALLLVDYLQSSGLAALDWQRVDTEQAMREAMRQCWDIVISDYTMPHFSGARALQILREYDPDTPFIFVSGTIGEQAAVEAIKVGAQDYVMKDELARLPHTIDRELHEVVLRRERRAADETLRKLSLVVKQTIDSVFITDPDGRIEYVNPAFEKLTGYRHQEAIGQTPALLYSDYNDPQLYKNVWQILKAGKTFRGTMVARPKNAELFHEEKVITPLTNEQGHITHYVSIGRDITERIKAEETHARLTAILEATPDPVSIIEPDGSLWYINNAGRRLLDLPAEENLEGRRLEGTFPASLARQFTDHIFPAAQRDGIWSGEIMLPLANGEVMPISQVVLGHHDTDGNIKYLSTIGRDITERKRFEAELQHHATHDRLTGLSNRFYLEERFRDALEHARRCDRHVGVLFLDLDNFKRVNDSLGHAAGDTLLQRVAQRLTNCLRPTDIIARHGGDEFAIIIGDLERVDDVLTVLGKLQAEFDRPILIENHQIYVTFSIGIALYPQDGREIENLLRHADTAMCKAKVAGTGQYQFYAADMNARGHELLTLEAELRYAVKHHEFVLHYQPQLDLNTGRICGAEALIRWQHPVRGLVSPGDFIPLLENSGLIITVGEWVLREACRMHRRCREAGWDKLRISINVSAVQFNDAELVNKIRAALREEAMPPQLLELEITENILMGDPVRSTDTLKELRGLGIRIAIDDFGTGYCSLAYLKQFPLNVLKIDQTFVRDIATDPKDAAIVESGIFLARKLGLEVTAEGVETREQLDLLQKHGCDLAQGYHLSRPLPEAGLLDFLRNPSIP